MNLGINVHQDEAGLPHLKWLKANTHIKNVRIDFPCKDYYYKVGFLAHLKDVLDECKDMDNIVLHIGYVEIPNDRWYSYFAEYIQLIGEIIIQKGMQRQVAVEFWNNLNLKEFWASDSAEFIKMWRYCLDSFAFLEKNSIRTAGFSFTLNHESSWKWMSTIKYILVDLDYVTIQIYPEERDEYIKLINRFEREVNLPYIVTEIGAMGDSETQLCQYRQIMYEIEKRTPCHQVYLYHLFNTGLDSKGRPDPWWLIDLKQKPRGLTIMQSMFFHPVDWMKKSARYLMVKYSLTQLYANRNEDMDCCFPRGWWRKIKCWLRRVYGYFR